MSLTLWTGSRPDRESRTEDTEVTEVWEHRKWPSRQLCGREPAWERFINHQKILRDLRVLRVLRASLPCWSERNGKASMIASANHILADAGQLWFQIVNIPGEHIFDHIRGTRAAPSSQRTDEAF